MSPLQFYCRLTEWLLSWVTILLVDRKKTFPLKWALILCGSTMIAWLACISAFLMKWLLAKEWNNGVLWGRGFWSILAVTGCACILCHWGFTYHFWNRRARKLCPSSQQNSPLPESPRWVFWVLSFVYLPVFSILTPLAAVLGVENIYGSYLWHKTQSQLEQKGEKIQWVHWASQPVSDEDNFASHPIFSAAQEQVNDKAKTAAERNLARSKAVEMLQMLNRPEILAQKHHLKKHPNSRSRPSMKSWASAYKEAIANQKTRGSSAPIALAELPKYPEAPEQASDLEVVDVALSIAEDLLKDISNASRRPHFRLSSTGDQPNFDNPFQTLSVIKKIANFLNFRSWHYLETNKPDQAAEDILLLLRMAKKIDDDPLLISHLVRIALTAIARNDIEDGFPKHQWTEDELIKLQNAFVQQDFLPSVLTTIKRERGVASLMFDQWIQGKGMWFGADGFMPMNSRFASRVMPGWIRQTQAAYLNILQNWLDVTAPQLNAPNTLHGINLLNSINPEVLIRKHSFNPHYNIANLVLPSIHKIYAKTLRIQQIRDQTITACALERYYLQHKTYPPTLHDLVPEYIPQVPLDIMDRSELKYERSEDGTFRLWSVGLDGEDDGGDTEKDRDWVWPRD
jgi:hypothetical protein